MSGGVAQILAIGAQDQFLTGTPTSSFFRSNYSQHVPFSQSVERQIIQGNPQPGAMTSIKVDRMGDLVNYMYLTATSRTTLVIQRINWETYIDKVELYIGSQLIDTQDSVFHGLVEPVAMAETYSKRYQSLGTNASPTTARFYPFKFFFCKDVQASLPLVGMQYQEVELRIYWASTMDSTLMYDCWANFIYLNGPERDYFINAGSSIDILVWQVQRQLCPNDYRVDLAFSNPVKFVCSNVLPYTDGNQQVKIQINGTDVGIFRGIPHFQDVSQYYTTPYGNHNPTTGGPTSLIMFPYCLDTASYQPTGTLNLSRIDSYRLMSIAGSGVPLQGGMGVNIFPPSQYIYAVNYNILRVQNGMASLLYAN